MSLSVSERDRLAQELYDAERSRLPIRLISERYPAMTLEDAYAVQAAGVKLRLTEGRSIIGHKVGLTSRVMQRALSIEQPDYGVLLDDMLFTDGAVPAGRFIKPRIEVELAFVLASDLTATDCDVDDVLAATAEMRPCFEILDARVEMVSEKSQRRRTIIDTVADNAADAGLVLGENPISPRATDLKWIPAMCYWNEQAEASGVSGSVLGNPAAAVAWLANTLSRYGVTLRAGEIILSGSFISPLGASKGDSFRAVFGDLGSVNCEFV
jgi:2-oxo-hept-3-ene-1,7-dioate hydratase